VNGDVVAGALGDRRHLGVAPVLDRQDVATPSAPGCVRVDRGEHVGEGRHLEHAVDVDGGAGTRQGDGDGERPGGWMGGAGQLERDPAHAVRAGVEREGGGSDPPPRSRVPDERHAHVLDPVAGVLHGQVAVRHLARDRRGWRAEAGS
jgi:hypothetical protein